MRGIIETRSVRGRLVLLIAALLAAFALTLASPITATATIKANPSVMEEQAAALTKYAKVIQSGTIANNKATVNKASGTIDQVTGYAQGTSAKGMVQAKQEFVEAVGSNSPSTAAAVLKKLAGKISALAQSYRAGEVGASLIWK